jgi:hypothetical protein
MNTIYTQGCARNLLKWWHSRFEHYSADGLNPQNDYSVFSNLLEKQVTALIAYKKLGEGLGMLPDNPACTAKALIKRVLQSFAVPPYSIIDYSPSYRVNFLESPLDLDVQLSQSFAWEEALLIGIRSKMQLNAPTIGKFFIAG